MFLGEGGMGVELIWCIKLNDSFRNLPTNMSSANTRTHNPRLDSALKFTNSEGATANVRRDYRKGWEVAGV